LPKNKLPYFKNRPQVRHLVFYTFCVIFCAVWFGLRYQLTWVWVFQDIMVVAITLNILSLSLFRAYKWCFLAMFFFLIYDMFMIFFLPLITGENKVNKSLCFGLQASIFSEHEAKKNSQIINFNIDRGDSNFVSLISLNV